MQRFKNLIHQFQNIQIIDCKDLPPAPTTTNANSTDTSTEVLISEPLQLPKTSPFPELLKDSSNLNPAAIVHSNHWAQNQMLELAASGLHHCFLNTLSPLVESELYSSLKIESNPLDFLSNPLPFWFRNKPETLVLSFKKKTDKLEMMRQMEPFIERTGSRLVQEHVRILFQELFMNAIFDAPRAGKTKGISASKKGCEIILAYDHEKFVISCTDHYGALDPLLMVKRIKDLLLAESTKVVNFDRKIGGAGIGSSLLFRYSSTLSIVVAEEKCTRVSCTVPLKMSQKKFNLLEKNLHYIKISMGGNYEKQRNA